MEEKKLFQEIPGGRNCFHSAVLTSFSFNFHHFEYQVLKSLRQKWISSVLVLADQRMLDDVLGVASGNLKQVSQSYSVIGMHASGAFHPKINFLIGDNSLLVFFGSGNITPGGHGKNHELFTGFFADKEDKKQLPLVIEAWNYIKHIVRDLDGYARNRVINVMPETCSLLNSNPLPKHNYCKLDDSIEIALLYNEESTIFEQLISLIPSEEISRITIVCPYYDEDGETLINLQNQFNNSVLDVYLPKDFGLPPTGLSQINSINFFAWEETERGKKTISGTEDYKRKLHSKLIHFKSEQYEYCLIGSANATVSGLGSLSKGAVNEEFCALYKTRGSDLLNSFGIIGKKTAINLSNHFRNENIETIEDKSSYKKIINLRSIDLSGSTLKVYIKLKVVIDSSYISIFDNQGNKIHREFVFFTDESAFSIQLKPEILKLNLGFAIMEDKEGNPISNKQLINFIDKLINTDPSKGNRSIRQILSAIEGGVINEFEIIEFINNLRKKESEQVHLERGKIFQPEIEEKTESSASGLTYEEAVAAAREKGNYENVAKTYSSTRLWETISQLFKEKQASIDDELMDEEEQTQANAVKSKDRKIAIIESQSIQVKDVDHFHKMIYSANKMVEEYKQALNNITYKANHEIDKIDLSQFLLVTHIYTVVCNFIEYKFTKKTDSFKWKDHLSNLYSQSMMDILVAFSKLFIKFNEKKFEKNEYEEATLKGYIQKASYHLWVYLYLIERKASAGVIMEKMELVGLNLIHYLGKPDNQFEIYLDNMSASYNRLNFNPDSVIRLFERIKNIENHSKFAEGYLLLQNLGICRIIERKGTQIVFKSLFGKHVTSITKLKKING